MSAPCPKAPCAKPPANFQVELNDSEKELIRKVTISPITHGEYMEYFRLKPKTEFIQIMSPEISKIFDRISYVRHHEIFTLLYREADQATHQLAHAKLPPERRVAQLNFTAKLKKVEEAGKKVGANPKLLSTHFHQKLSGYQNDPANLPFQDPQDHPEWDLQKSIVARTFGLEDKLRKAENFNKILNEITKNIQKGGPIALPIHEISEDTLKRLQVE